MKKLPNELDSIAWQIYRELLPEAERFYGPREDGFTVTEILHDPSGPEMRLDGYSIALIVGPNASAYRPTLISNIAHEIVHTLNPRTGNANSLEEGAAVYFELNVIERRYGVEERHKFWNCLPQTYRTALDDFENLYEYDEHPGQLIREQFGAFSAVTTRNLRQLYRKLPADVASRLVSSKRMRPAAGITKR